MVESGAIDGTSIKTKIASRLFYVSNVYRKDFDEFEKFLDADKDGKYMQKHKTIQCNGKCSGQKTSKLIWTLQSKMMNFCFIFSLFPSNTNLCDKMEIYDRKITESLFIP